METLKNSIIKAARTTEDASKADRIAAVREVANLIREAANCRGMRQLWDIEEIVTKQERRHRKGRSSYSGSRYSESVPVAVDYFLIRTLAHAADTVGRSGKDIARRLGGARQDYLVAFSLYAAHKGTFKSMGLTRARLEHLACLVDYVRDIA